MLIYRGAERRVKARADIISKILVCDDDRDFCEVLRHWIDRIKCQCVIVHGCKSCLEKVKQEFFKIILLDNVFEDGRGVDIIADIREASPATKVLIVTGYGVIEDKLVALNYGAGYLEKPLDFKSLMAKLSLVLSE